ncbi:spore germination protein KA [Paenibacillus sp. UNCCL117]|uniref:spore germination protein n=1 Tax=unclassified Paenibacillus TaxID=185978 RepID=UPI000889F710|nr:MULTISPECIES: spore germination protein [unclassified Paenibacillus]SDD42092.1 spore germination protein KA [Paenibacillus sp. cl123]SFW47691.1 spore germination protein KA [Paenibacillus sp. UNCCL117]
MISPELDDNLKRLEAVFADCDDLTLLPWSYGTDLNQRALAVYFTSMVKEKNFSYTKEILEGVVLQEAVDGASIEPEHIIRFFEGQGVSEQKGKVLHDFDQTISQILEGCLVLFFDQWQGAVAYKTFGLQHRQVTEPINEPSVIGPREGTIENLETNMGLLRSRLRNPLFKLKLVPTGKNCGNELFYGYLDGAVNPETLAEFERRLARAAEYDILEPSYLEELIEDSTYSPFPQYRYSERPDVAIAALLDGKIIVMTQGSPSIMIGPSLFVEFFSTPEDFYQRTVHATLIRLLRIGAFIFALTLPSIYIAFSTFHPELLPTVLLLAILDTREGIPFPAFIEAFVMEFFFELLREAGIRLPKPVGSAVSIVGALVIGQAAIQARIASPIMVIVVAATGIASFAIPQYNLAITLRILRFPLMICAATLGGFGLMIGFLLTLLHLTCLRSLGQPYLSALAPMDIWQLRDVFIRFPLKFLFRSPRNRHAHQRVSKWKQRSDAP